MSQTSGDKDHIRPRRFSQVDTDFERTPLGLKCNPIALLKAHVGSGLRVDLDKRVVPFELGVKERLGHKWRICHRTVGDGHRLVGH